MRDSRARDGGGGVVGRARPRSRRAVPRTAPRRRARVARRPRRRCRGRSARSSTRAAPQRDAGEQAQVAREPPPARTADRHRDRARHRARRRRASRSCKAAPRPTRANAPTSRASPRCRVRSSTRQPDVGTLLAAEAYRRRATDDTKSTLLSALQAHPLLDGLLYGANSRLEAVVFTPDGKQLVTPTSDGTGTLIWDTRTRRRIAQLKHGEQRHAGRRRSAPTAGGSRCRRSIATEGIPGRAVADLGPAHAAAAAVVASPADALSSAAFSADGRCLFTQGGHTFSETSTVACRRVGHRDVEADRPAMDGCRRVPRRRHGRGESRRPRAGRADVATRRSACGTSTPARRSGRRSRSRVKTCSRSRSTPTAGRSWSPTAATSACSTPRPAQRRDTSDTGLEPRRRSRSPRSSLSADGSMLAVGDVEGEHADLRHEDGRGARAAAHRQRCSGHRRLVQPRRPAPRHRRPRPHGRAVAARRQPRRSARSTPASTRPRPRRTTRPTVARSWPAASTAAS